jgi:hypothetical protein
MSNDIIAAAQAILAELPDLLPAETAAEYDRKIRTLLSQIDNNQAQPAQLTELLRQAEPTRQWVRRFLEGKRGSGEDITRSLGFSGLPGDDVIQAGIVYKCPHCPEKFTREGNEDVPMCSTHLVALVPVRP